MTVAAPALLLLVALLLIRLVEHAPALLPVRAAASGRRQTGR